MINAPVTVVDKTIVATVNEETRVVTAVITEQARNFTATVQNGIKGDKGDKGDQGDPGPPGAVVVQYTAGEALGGHRIVILDDSPLAFYASNNVLAHANKILGMTTGAVAIDDLATIQTSGEVTEPSWAWVLNTPIWLGVNGLLTQTAPTSGFSLIVGFPITSTKILIRLREPIFLV